MKVKFTIGEKRVRSVSHKLKTGLPLIEEIKVKYTSRTEYATVNPSAENIIKIINWFHVFCAASSTIISFE